MSNPELTRKVPLFSDCTTAELMHIEKKMQKVSFNPGGTIFKRGDVGDALYVIREGEVEVMAPGMEEGDADSAVARLHPGDLFGEMALVMGQPRTATVRAVAEVRCLRLPREYFEELMRDDSVLALKVYKQLTIILSHRLMDTTERLAIANRIIHMTSRK